MNHMMNYLEGDNETINFTNSILGNYFLETTIGCYIAMSSPITSKSHFDLLQCSHTSDNDSYILDLNNGGYTNLYVNNDNLSILESSIDMWMLDFDGCKMHDGSGTECISINLNVLVTQHNMNVLVTQHNMKNSYLG